MYDPQSGRFASPNSIIPDMTNFNDYNPYMYVRGNPMRYTDPTGYASQDTDGGVVLDTVTVYPKTYDAQNYSHNTSINMAQQHANTVVNNTINSQTNYNSPSVSAPFRSQSKGHSSIPKGQSNTNLISGLFQSAKKNIKFGTSAKAVYGAGVGTSSIFTIYGISKGYSTITLDYARGAIIEAGIFIRGDVYSFGQINGFYQSGEICAIGCIRGAWDYQGNFNIGTRIVFPFSFGASISGGYATSGKELLDNFLR